MINYPIKKNKYIRPKISVSNRGMGFEDMINDSNKKYLDNNIAVIYKKPTPIQIVNVDYPKRSKAKIDEAYYKTPSTTDYNGIYKGYYIDFDAKETMSKTSFPLSNIGTHQVSHLEKIYEHGGIGFILLFFKELNEIYLIHISHITKFLSESVNGGRKSIPYSYIKDNCILIKESYPIRVPYLKGVDLIIKERSE